MTLRQSFFVPPVPFVAAQEQGLLDDFDIVSTRTTGSAEQMDGLLGGELDLAVTAIDNLFEWTRAGADVRLVAQVEPTTPLSIWAHPRIATFEDLGGARFAVDALNNGFALVARFLLAQAHIDVQFVEVGGVHERLQSLLTGGADATLLGPPFDSQARQAGQRLLLNVQDVFPTFPGQGLVVRSAVLGSEEVQRYLAVLGTLGLLPVDPDGLELLTGIRRSLGLLPDGADLQALVSTMPVRR